MNQSEALQSAVDESVRAALSSWLSDSVGRWGEGEMEEGGVDAKRVLAHLLLASPGTRAEALTSSPLHVVPIGHGHEPGQPVSSQAALNGFS